MEEIKKKERVLSYDVFRGFLLIGMVVFHVLVNLTPLQFNQELFYWVPLGFVLFLGVILARFLRGKNRKKIELVAKLAGLFIVLNIPNFIGKNIDLIRLVKGDREMVSFEILLPMCAVVLTVLFWENLFVSKRPNVSAGRHINRAAASLLFIFLAVLALSATYYYNLNFTVYGLIGYFCAVDLDLNSYLNRRNIMIPALMIAVAPFSLVRMIDFIVVLQVFAMYLVVGSNCKNIRFLALAGKYSLILYVGHILIIKALQLWINA